MKCPFCGYLEQRVLDSRSARESLVIRRRRECYQCHRRFTTFEEIETSTIYVIKRDGTREEFRKEKILQGMVIASRRRPVTVESLQQVAEDIEYDLHDKGVTEVCSNEIGTMILSCLKDLDEVSYIRFASVYQDFKSAEEFIELVCRLDTDLSICKKKRIVDVAMDPMTALKDADLDQEPSRPLSEGIAKVNKR